MSREDPLELDRLEQLAPPIPNELLRAAAEEGRRAVERRGDRRRRRGLLALGIGVACTALAFTPPGHDATGWLAETVGLKQKPSLPQIDVVSGSARVLATGQLEDGTEFELVGKRVPAVANGDLLCLQVDWPGLQDEGRGGACTRTQRSGEAGGPPLETSGLFSAPPDERPIDDPALLAGLVDDPGIEKVEVTIARAEEDMEVREVTLLAAPSQLTDGRQVTAFAAPLSAVDVAAVEAGEATIRVTGYDGNGQVVDQQRALLGPALPQRAPPSPASPERRNDR